VVKALRERSDPPLLVEIPDRHGSRREADFLTAYIREAIGVKIE
jgi:V/A-type H+-transporting ATPase subunit F